MKVNLNSEKDVILLVISPLNSGVAVSFFFMFRKKSTELVHAYAQTFPSLTKIKELCAVEQIKKKSDFWEKL